MKNSIPLINDNSNLPIPSIGIDIDKSPKSNAKILSQILALGCVKLVLPDLKIQSFEEISTLRENTKDYVKPFRLKMLELCESLNNNITSETNMKETLKEAKFIVDTKVYPEIIKLEEYIKSKSKSWFKRLIFDFGESVPEITANFSTMTPETALIKFLTKFGAIFVKSLFNIYENNRCLIKNGLYYLLRLKK